MSSSIERPTRGSSATGRERRATTSTPRASRGEVLVTLRDEGRMLASVHGVQARLSPAAHVLRRLFSRELTESWTYRGPGGSRRDVPTSTGPREAVAPASLAFCTFEGIRGGLFHRLLVAPKQARAGVRAVRLKPRNGRTGTIADIEGFEPVRS